MIHPLSRILSRFTGTFSEPDCGGKLKKRNNQEISIKVSKLQHMAADQCFNFFLFHMQSPYHSFLGFKTANGHQSFQFWYIYQRNTCTKYMQKMFLGVRQLMLSYNYSITPHIHAELYYNTHKTYQYFIFKCMCKITNLQPKSAMLVCYHLRPF